MVALWKPQTLQGIALASEQARGLMALTRRFLPATFKSAGRHSDWPLAGYAMMSRACGTLGSVMALIPERRASDAAVLTRVLYEEIVTFAWIGVDPSDHAEAWVRWDRDWRIKADNDLQDIGAEPLLDPGVRQDFERGRDAGELMPDLAQRATAADQHWSKRLDAIADDPTSPRTLRGMYRYIYRGESQYAHAAAASIDRLVVDAQRPGRLRVVTAETDPGENNAFTRASILYALGLIVAEPVLGWSGVSDAVDNLFAALG